MEPEGNVPPLLHDRFANGEREKMMTVWDSARMYGVTDVGSYQKHVRWIFVIFSQEILRVTG